MKNNNFNRVGFYYSQYLYASIGLDSKGRINYNAEVFYNEEKKIIMINLLATVRKEYIPKFYDEFFKLWITEYQVQNITLLGSMDNSYIKEDKELFNTNVDTFYISNSTEDLTTKYKLRKFANLLAENGSHDKSAKHKSFEEFHLINGQSFIKKFIKLLNKSAINFTYVLVFGLGVFDPFGGLGLYNKACSMLGLSNKDEVVKRDLNDFTSFFKDFKLKMEEGWLLYLKE